MARVTMNTSPTRITLPTPAPVATSSSQDTPYSDHVMTQVAESGFFDYYARHPHWHRAITIGTLDLSPSMSVPDNPVGTVANMDPMSTAAPASPVQAPSPAGDTSSNAPLGGDLNSITDKICKLACVPGQQVTVWDNYATAHNGTHLTTTHTTIYCDDQCIARVRSITTDSDSVDGDDDPTTVVSSAAAAVATTTATAATMASAADTPAPASIAGSANLFF